MPILATLRQSRAGEWKNLDEYLRELRHRETGALAALANALSAPPQEQKELVAHGEGGAILIEIACDLRVPKGARLAASRALLEAGITGPFVGHLFIGAGDLVTDPRLGAMARKLVESGLPSALQLGGEPAQITLAAGAFARAAYAGASAVGAARIQELLEPAKKLHAGAIAALFALDAGELPEDHRNGWKRLLEQTCAAHRRAPAAARRVGLVPAWPPNLPEKFAPFIEEAERQNATVESADAAANPAVLKKARAATQPTGKSREATTEKVLPPPAGKKLAPPICRSRRCSHGRRTSCASMLAASASRAQIAGTTTNSNGKRRSFLRRISHPRGVHAWLPDPSPPGCGRSSTIARKRSIASARRRRRAGPCAASRSFSASLGPSCRGTSGGSVCYRGSNCSASGASCGTMPTRPPGALPPGSCSIFLCPVALEGSLRRGHSAPCGNRCQKDCQMLSVRAFRGTE